MIRNRSVSLACGVTSSLIWGLSFIWYKTAYLAFRPLTLVTLRLLITVLLLSLVIGIRGSRSKISPHHWKYFWLMSAFEPFLYFLGESFGMQCLSSTLGALIVATIPLFTPLTACFIYRERLRWSNAAGLLVSFAGVGVVVSQGRMDVLSPWGIPLMFLAVFSALGYSTILKKLSGIYDTLTIVRTQSFLGLLMFAPLCLLFEARHFPLHAPANSWLAVLALGVMASCVAYMCLNIAIRDLGLIATGLLANLVPVFTATFAYFLLHERFGTMKILGGGMVLLGVLVFQFENWRKKFRNIPARSSSLLH